MKSVRFTWGEGQEDAGKGWGMGEQKEADEVGGLRDKLGPRGFLIGIRQ